MRLVQLARLASVTGRWAYTITLAVYAYRIGGAGGVALVGIVRLAPAAAVSPFAGTLIRRTRLERLLVAGGLLRSAALVAAGVVVLLLRDVPRTATIRALTDIQLQRLDRARFIGTVTGNSTSADAADAVVGSRLGLRSGFTAV